MTWLPGSVLVEVMVAIVILGVFLGGLARTVDRSRDGAAELHARAAAMPGSLLEGGLAAAWEWGAMVDWARWAAGPELMILSGRGCRGEVTAGIWCDGWFLGEWSLLPGEELLLGEEVWTDRSGSELVVRVRAEDTGWGAPWRTVVPGEYGENLGPLAEARGAVGTSILFNEAEIVAHVRTLGIPPLVLSWSAAKELVEVEGTVLALEGSGTGLCILESDGRAQSWMNREGRGLDVYW